MSSLDQLRPVTSVVANTDEFGATKKCLPRSATTAFDDCGGHIRVHQGYHYYASTGCTDKIDNDDGHAPLIGYAADGYPIYANKNAEGAVEEDLDDCRGQTDDIRGYHYHAPTPSENTFISCFTEESVATGRGLVGHHAVMDIIDKVNSDKESFRKPTL